MMHGASNLANSLIDHQPNFQRTASRPPRGVRDGEANDSHVRQRVNQPSRIFSESDGGYHFAAECKSADRKQQQETKPENPNVTASYIGQHKAILDTPS